MMKYTELREGLNVSRIVMGCWRIDSLDQKAATKLVSVALDNGINSFDHADIYGAGISEERFGQAWKELGVSRDKLFLQSKAGIFLKENYYDFSKKHILEAVEGSLRRLKTDYLDLFLLHRPDTLFEPEQVAEAFDRLERDGKVRAFGVSNQNPTQIELLRKYVRQNIIVNQMQFSVVHSGLVDAGLCVNNHFDSAIVRDGGALEYCRLHDIWLQAWSPFQYGLFEGVYLNDPKYPDLNAKLNEIAAEQGVTAGAVAAAWILRHPAFAQCIIGTMKTSRLVELCKATEVILTVHQWYDIYKSAGHIVP